MHSLFVPHNLSEVSQIFREAGHRHGKRSDFLVANLPFNLEVKFFPISHGRPLWYTSRTEFGTVPEAASKVYDVIPKRSARQPTFWFLGQSFPILSPYADGCFESRSLSRFPVVLFSA